MDLGWFIGSLWVELVGGDGLEKHGDCWESRACAGGKMPCWGGGEEGERVERPDLNGREQCIQRIDCSVKLGVEFRVA